MTVETVGALLWACCTGAAVALSASIIVDAPAIAVWLLTPVMIVLLIAGLFG